MPLIENSSYHPPFYFRNGHISTIYSGRVKLTKSPNYKRETLELTDGDFLVLDGIENSNSKKALILCHGLEGDSRRSYNNTAANYFFQKGFSVFAWNNRSCGGGMNRLPRFYHHATVEDLDFVAQTVLEKGFDEVYLMGFSLGAAQILNYFGRTEIDKKIKAGVAVSAPVQLKSCSEKLKTGFNRVYLNVFTKKLKKKFQEKAQVFPDQIDTSKINSIRTFDEVDEYFTAPLHGFENKDDYYEKASPGYSIEKIKTPVLIINALDDPFLGEDCYPFEFTKENEFVFLETPKFGGHCAFPLPGSRFSWTDFRAYEFFNSEITSKGF